MTRNNDAKAKAMREARERGALLRAAGIDTTPEEERALVRAVVDALGRKGKAAKDFQIIVKIRNRKLCWQMQEKRMTPHQRDRFFAEQIAAGRFRDIVPDAAARSDANV